MRTLEQWAAVIDAMKASGMSQNEWCTSQGINWGSMHAARMKLNKAKSVKGDSRPKFIEVQPQQVSPTVTINCKGLSLSLSVADAAAILKALAGEGTC